MSSLPRGDHDSHSFAGREGFSFPEREESLFEYFWDFTTLGVYGSFYENIVMALFVDA